MTHHLHKVYDLYQFPDRRATSFVDIGTAYYIKVNYKGWDYYKIGYTGRTTEERIKELVKGKSDIEVEVLEEFNLASPEEVYGLECGLHKAFKSYLPACQSRILTQGNSELYLFDVLGYLASKSYKLPLGVGKRR